MPLILKDPFFLEEQKCCYGSLLLCTLLQHEESERCTNFCIPVGNQGLWPGAMWNHLPELLR